MTSVVVPLTASFNANGTAGLKQVMQEAVSALAADWDLFISDPTTNDVFKAFSIAEGAADDSADIVVTVAAANAAIVKAAIKAALMGATGGNGATSGAGGQTLKALLEAYVKAQVEADLAASGLFNILEAEALINVAIPNATIGDNGSEAMWDTTLTGAPQAVLNVIATQLPYGQYSSIPDGDNLDSAFAVGDKLVLNFSVSSVLTVTPENEDVTGSVAGGGFADATDAGAPAQAAFNAAQKTRTFNLHITKA